MKQIQVIIFILCALHCSGQRPIVGKPFEEYEKNRLLFNCKESGFITREEFLSALNDSFLPLTFSNDSIQRRFTNIESYTFVIIPVADKDKMVMENINGKTSEIKRLLESFSKDLSDVKMFLIMDIRANDISNSKYKFSNGLTIQFKSREEIKELKPNKEVKHTYSFTKTIYKGDTFNCIPYYMPKYQYWNNGFSIEKGGLVLDGKYLKVPDGKLIGFYEDTNLVCFTGQVKNGLEFGEWIYYDTLGKIDFCTGMKKGNYEGLFKEYYYEDTTSLVKSNLYKEGFYNNGIKTGVWKFYTLEGSLTKTQGRNYAGNLSGLITWFTYDSLGNISQKESGYPYEKKYFEGGSFLEILYRNPGRIEDNLLDSGIERIGTWKLFYKNGNLQSREIYGHKNFRIFTYYENGARESELFYTKELYIAHLRFWDMSGKLIESADFDDTDSHEKRVNYKLISTRFMESRGMIVDLDPASMNDEE